MALNLATFQASLKSLFDTMQNDAAAGSPHDNLYYADQLGSLIDGYIRSATVTVTVTSVSGVTTGPSASGPGSGTGTIT